MRLTVSEIASLVGGTVRGDGAVVIEGAAGLGEATPRDLSFLANPKYKAQLETTRAGALLVTADVATGARAAVIVKNPSDAWAAVLEILDKERTRRPAGVHPTAVIAPGAKIGINVVVGAHTVIEDGAAVGDNTILYPRVYVGFDTTVGADCLIYPGVTLRERTTVGNRCVLQPGVVVGGDGYGFAFGAGRHRKIPQIGTVVIEDDVEIQANSTIDRAAVGVTRIGRGTKIDNLVQIAHGAEIGENCLIVALTGVAGSTKIGNFVTLAAQVGVAGHLKIGDQTIVAAQSGVSHDLPPKSVVFGTPAQSIKDEMKCQAATRQLPKLLEEFRAIKKKMGWGS